MKSIALVLLILTSTISHARTEPDTAAARPMNCSGNLTLEQMAKCIEAGYILSFKMPTEQKSQIASLSGCDSSSDSKSFNKCIGRFLRKKPQTHQLADAECWREVEIDKFEICMGWRKKLSNADTREPASEGEAAR